MGKKLFSLGEFSKYHIFLFLVPLFHMMSGYVQRDIILENKKTKNENEEEKQFYRKFEFSYLIITLFSKLFSGFLIIISKYLINKEHISYILVQTRSRRRYHLNVNANNKYKIFFYILIITTLELVVKIENNLSLTKKNLIDIKLGFTIFVPLLSYFLLKTKYYKHHFVSIGIDLFGFIFIILALISEEEEEKHPYYIHLIHFSFSFPFSLSLILIKYLFMHYFIKPFTYLFIDGILCVILSFLYILIKYILILNDVDLFKNNIINIFLIFNYADKGVILLFIFIIILTFLYHVAKTVSLYFFSPTLFVMTDILSPVMTWIIDKIYKKIRNNENLDIKVSIFKIIGYFFMIIACILFNEVIICNFWNLDYYTNKKIEERGIEDAVINANNSVSNNDTIISES